MASNDSLKKNSIYNISYRTLNVLFPLLSATYIARVLKADGVGKVAYAQNIVKYFSTVAALGIPNYGIREIAKVRSDIHNTSIVMSELLWINTVSTFICMVLYYGLIVMIPSFREEWILYSVVGLTIIFNFFNVDWFYQGYEEYRYIAVRSFFVKMVSLMGIFLFVKKRSDYSIYALISCLGIGGNNLCNIIHLKRYKVKLFYNKIKLKRHFKSVFILLGSAIAVELYTLLDTTMLGAMCSDESVGYYTNSMRLVKILITVVTAIGAVLLPRLSYYKSIGNQNECDSTVSKVFTILFFLFVPCEIGIFIMSEQIIMVFFGSSFMPAVTTLRIGALLICVLGFSNLFGTQVLLTYEQEKKLLITTVAGAIINIILNVLLIPLLQQNGAAIASVISESVVTVLSIIYASKYVRVTVLKEFIIKVLVSSSIMTLIVYFFELSIVNIYLNLTISVTLGILSYILCNVLIRNPVISDLKVLIKTRRKKENETV